MKTTSITYLKKQLAAAEAHLDSLDPSTLEWDEAWKEVDDLTHQLGEAEYQAADSSWADPVDPAQEAWEHDQGIQSEAQMCMEEARMNIPQDAQPQGSGEYQVKISELWHCRSTDAVVGAYVSAHHCFPTREEAEAFFKSLPEYLFYDSQAQLIIPQAELDAEQAAMNAALEVNLEECPF